MINKCNKKWNSNTKTNLVAEKKSGAPLERMLIDSHGVISDLHATYITILLLQTQTEKNSNFKTNP